LQLGHSCGFEEAHAKHVAELAQQLFDSSSTAGLHKLGELERELLEYTGLLHDIGIFLSYRRHRAHSYYFIRNAELLGFDETEIAVMAVTALYHHKSYPRRKHPQFDELDKQRRGVVRILCVLLRMAESLDRTHSQVVKKVELRPVDDKTCLLEIRADGDCQLEIGEVQNHVWSFKKSFKRQLIVSVNGVEIEEPTSTDPQLVSG
jgi:exopolyphosphatase/guanosine-5'-triphosphate,3'-diphosphate pyrophosphatase